MRQFTFENIERAINEMAAEGIIGQSLTDPIIKHFNEYMTEKRSATLRETTACALLLEALQIHDV